MPAVFLTRMKDAPPSARPRGSADVQTDFLPIDEEGGGSGVWWLLVALLAGLAGAIYYWMRP